MNLHRHTRRAAAASAVLAVLIAGAACGTQTATDVSHPNAPSAGAAAQLQVPQSSPSAHSPISADAAEHYGAERGRPGITHPTPDATP